MREGVTLPQARAELDAINRRLEAAHPDTNRGLMVTAVDQAQFMSGAHARVIWGSLWVGAYFVLLVASANVANLSLARTVGRRRELQTRLALGAGRARMIRQLLLESVVIAAVAGAAAWPLMAWSVGWWAEATASQYQTIDYALGLDTLVYLALVAPGAEALLDVPREHAAGWAPRFPRRALGGDRDRGE
jgi:hypothetical protein